MGGTNLNPSVTAEEFIGDVTGNVTGKLFGKVESLAANGAVDVDDMFLLLDGSVATAQVTLADGVEGQLLFVKATNVTNIVDITPANFADGTKITFNLAGDVAILFFDGSAWQVLYTDGTVS